MLNEFTSSGTMVKKLILPAEVKVCATCSYWDGERRVDPEFRIVVVDDCCKGECLVQGECREGLTDEFEWHKDCLWEHLAPDEPEVGQGHEASDKTKAND